MTQSKRSTRVQHKAGAMVALGMSAALGALAAGCVGGQIGNEGACEDDACDDAELNANKDWAPGRVLVQFRPGLGQDKKDEVLAAHGGQSAAHIQEIDVHVVNLPPGADEEVVARVLSKNPHVKFAELDRKLAPEMTPNDPSLASEWHLATMGSATSWDIANGTGVTIAILDSGIDLNHPDLQAQLVPGWNFYDNNDNIADVSGHGTAVAGSAAAAGNNGIGVAGVAFGAKIMPIRVTDTAGYGYFSSAAAGLTWAADHGARVANFSYLSAPGSATMQNAAQYMKNKGGQFVVSSGNSGTDLGFADTDTMIVVAATGPDDLVTGFSTFGADVDVAAPGSGIYTTSLGSTYGGHSGTSFSSPITAGVIAQMMSANPKLAPAQVESLLKSTAVDRGDPGYDIHYGAGRVNAAAAVQAAAGAQVSDTQAPTVAISSPTGGTVSGIVNVNVNASDNVGVTLVELLVNGSVVASDSAAPYALSWDSRTVADGGVSLTARARDAAGNVKVSTAVALTVANTAPVADTVAPTVAITSPVEGAVVRRNVTVAVAASDNVAVTQITLTLDGAVVASGSSSTLTYVWNTRKALSGAHTLVATALDAAGNQSTSTVHVTK